ncbi:MAG: DUF1460 domain-containing protein [Prevotella sp.]|jgi:hypothetical protein|nr:DUF1460 domain-containing protein [Prevotella sp.]
MRHIFTLLFALWLIPAAVVGADKEAVTYQKKDSVTVCRLLAASRQLPRGTNLQLFFARKFLGLPYVAHTLEINDDERLVVNTRQLDCTTLVENVTALTLCAQRGQYTWRDYLRTLTAMRYRNGKITDYTSRIHYFTEWITANTKEGIVTEIQSPNPPFSAVQQVSVSFMSNHPKSYKALRNHPEYVADIKKMEQQVSGQRFRYIPKTAVRNHSQLRKAVKDGDIIAITCRKKGLDIAHLGFAVWKEGKLHLLNASQLRGQVVEEPKILYEYLQEHPTHTGIRIIRINK